MFLSIDGVCPKCKVSDALSAQVEAAAHDHSLLDILVDCRECHQTFNAFVRLDEMEVL